MMACQSALARLCYSNSNHYSKNVSDLTHGSLFLLIKSPRWVQHLFRTAPFPVVTQRSRLFMSYSNTIWSTHGFQVTTAIKKSWNVTHWLLNISFQSITYNFSSQTTGQIVHMVSSGLQEAGKYEEHMNSIRSKCVWHIMKLFILGRLHH